MHSRTLSPGPQPAAHDRAKLAGRREISHLTIEVHRCAGAH